MRVVVEGPAESPGNVLTTLMQRRGMIIGSQEDGIMARIEAEVPLAEMFGYATALRSATQGQGGVHDGVLALRRRCPPRSSEKLIEDAAEEVESPQK